MRFGFVLLICSIGLSFGQHRSASAKADTVHNNGATAELLAGAWRLVSVETIKPDGSIIYPFYGRHPEGILLYDRSGWMSAQIVSDPKPTVPVTDSREGFLAAASAEKLSAVDGYYAYFGTWAFDPAASKVTHHIKNSLYPGERGEDGVRQVVLQGNQLTLTTKTHEMGEEHTRKLVWQRAQSLPQ